MRWPSLLRRIPRPRLTLTLAALFTIYLVLGFFVLPRYLQRAIPEQIAQHLKRQAVLSEVSVNPLALSVELRGFALKDTDGRTMLGWHRLLVNFELSSLVRWAWTFSTIVLEGLEVNADIAPDGRFNFAALADSLPKDERPRDPQAKPVRLLLQHFALVDSAVI